MRRAGRAGREKRGRWVRALPLRTRVIIAGSGCLAAWLLFALGAQYFRTYTLSRTAARLERHQHELLIHNTTLRAEIQRLRTDDQYVEKLAREQLGMLRPGEVEFVVIPPAMSPRAGAAGPAGPGDAAPDPETGRSIGTTVSEQLAHIRALLEHLIGRR